VTETGLPDITADLRLLLERAIYFDPWLGAISERQLNPRAEFALEDQVAALIENYWTPEEKARSLGRMPSYLGLVHECVRIAALSTFCLRGVYDGVPRVPDEAGVEQLFTELAAFASEHGIAPIVRAGLVLLGYEDLLAIDYFGAMREDDFLTGRLHRPWAEKPLDEELGIMVVLGTCEIDLQDGVRVVRATDLGRQRLADLRQELVQTGYLSRRVQALYIAHFDEEGADYDTIFDHIVPETHATRRAFLDFCHLQPGQQVLEIASGTGLFTVNAGLAELIGESGVVYGVDPSPEMTQVARRRLRERNLRNVRLMSGRAEQLPFEDASLDAVVGCLALHFTDAPSALCEAHRVLVPGGTVGMFWSLPWDLRRIPLFAEWLAPLERMMQHPDESGFSDRRFLSLDDAGRILGELGFVDIELRKVDLRHELYHVEETVRAILSMGIYQREFEQLPWAAREDLIRLLLARGEDLVQRHGPEALTFLNSSAFLRARRSPDDDVERHVKVLSLERVRRERISREASS